MGKRDPRPAVETGHPRHRFANGVEVMPGRCSGQPVIQGSRLTTSTIWSCFAACGWSLAHIAREYPSVTRKQIEAALQFECALRARLPWAMTLRDG